MEKYSEHAKLWEIKDESQAIGEFVEWLGGKGIFLAEDKECTVSEYLDRETGSSRGWDLMHADQITENPEWFQSGTYRIHIPIEKLLASFFDIDQEKLEEEKREMLEEMRALQKDS